MHRPSWVIARVQIFWTTVYKELLTKGANITAHRHSIALNKISEQHNLNAKFCNKLPHGALTLLAG